MRHIENLPTYQYFECHGKKWKKFWSIAQDGKAVITQWGKVDSRGQENKSVFTTSAKAYLYLQMKVEEKKAKGYKLVEVTDPNFLSSPSTPIMEDAPWAVF